MSAQVKAKLSMALEKIGKSNGHNVPASQDPIVEPLHEYFVCTIAEAYFKKRREIAKKTVEGSLSELAKKKLVKTIASVVDNAMADSCMLIETDPYNLSVDIKNGASFLDTQKLKVALMREHKMDATKVEALFESCTDKRAPAKSWKVTER